MRRTRPSASSARGCPGPSRWTSCSCRPPSRCAERLHLAVSDPERPRSPIHLGPAEMETLAHAGVTGAAWAGIWLPPVLEGREGSVVRLAPIVHSGEVLGLIVAERPGDAVPMTA